MSRTAAPMAMDVPEARPHAGPSVADVPLNHVVEGDCLPILESWPDECIDLAYLDPPFNTGGTRAAAAASFPDRWQNVAAYVAFLRPRVSALHRLVKPTGSILLHCDWRTSHHTRLLLDDVFGPAQFVNHLIWSYGLGGSSPRRFARKHDDILFYAKSPAYYFAAPRVAATSARMRGMNKKATDVLSVPSINNMAAERVGYPTQKPLALLTMLVRACCLPDGVVLDPFCGSGTTLVAAARLQRSFIGIDVNPDAVDIARARLASGGVRD